MKNIFYTLLIAFMFNAAASAQVDRSKAPQPGPAPAINISDYKSFTLANGLKVFVVENTKLPAVSLRLTIDYNGVMEGANAGYVEATGMMMRNGTATRPKDVLDKEIDMIGANIGTDGQGLSASSLKKHMEKLFELASDVILHPGFRQKELDKVKQQMLTGYTSSKDDPEEIANRVQQKAYFGTGHPYSESENEASIKSITVDLCKKHYESYFRPNISYLAVVGDIKFDEAKKLVEKYFSAWEKKDVPVADYPAPEPPLITKVIVVDRPNAVQSTVRIGHPVNLSPASEDVIAASAANTVLGGGMFRLFQNLREKHGYTYGAYSRMRPDKIIGSFTASANVRNEVTDSAVTEFLYELKRMGSESVPDTELSRVKNYLTGNFAISLENPQTVAGFAINTARYKLPADYYKNYLKKLSEINPADVRKIASKYILPKQSYIIVVGKASDVAEKLKQFTPTGKIEYRDYDGNVIDPSAASAPADVTAEMVIDRYVTAIGGRENLLKVQDRATTMSGKLQGMEVTSTIYQKAPNKYLMKMSFGEMEQVVLFDGKKGVQRGMMGENVLKDAELEEIAFQVDMTAILRLKELNVSAKLTGKVKVGTEDAYRIELTLPKGSRITHYYSELTGLKLKEERNMNTPNGTFTAQMEFGDYREVEGVKYPYSVKQSAGGMGIDLKVIKIDVNKGISDSVFGN